MKLIIHFYMVASFTVASLNASTQNPPSTSTNNPSMTERIFPEGKYILYIKRENNKPELNPPNGRIEISKINDSIFTIKLRYVGAAPAKNLGIIQDQIKIIDNKAIYQPKDDSTCSISFVFFKNSVKIVQQSTSSAFSCGFGRNVHIDGEYIKLKEDPTIKPKTSLKEGKYGITLQWIGWEKRGVVNITDAKNGFYQIQGKQISDNGKDYLEIVGIVNQVANNQIRFEGKIKSVVSYINQGKVCERNGKFTFIHLPGKKYWRLRESANCEGGMVTDYIDLYLD